MQKDIVLCKIYRKAKSMKELEQRAAMEQINQVLFDEASSSSVNEDNSASNNQQNLSMTSTQSNGWDVKNTADEMIKREIQVSETTPSLQSVNEPLLELLVPNYNFDLIHDTFFPQMCSAWLDQGSPYANLLNF
jgi:hypothetical protein